MAEKESSLNELYLQAKNQQERLDLLDPRSEDFKSQIRSTVSTLTECQKQVDQLALFSTNEELDDVSTIDLRYLSLDYSLAELVVKQYGDNRDLQLKTAIHLLERFLTRLDQYDLLEKNEHKLFERFKENRTSFSLITSQNAEQRRGAKVARFQEEKALKSKLQVLRTQNQANHIDEEVVRKLYLAELALCTHQSFQSLDMISQELAILAQMLNTDPSRSNDAEVQADMRRNGQRLDSYSERLDSPTIMGGLGQRRGPLLDPRGKPLQPFTLTDKRSQLQKGVFRSGHNLPTMSIDEYLEEERRRGGIIEGGGNANDTQPEPEEDNIEAVDAATMKAREWDEFVEANPKGAGNTLNRG